MQAAARVDTLACLLLGAATFASRAALRSHGPFSIDGTLLALAVDEYDFASYRPHPPYYPLTIALARVLALWMPAVDALVWLAVASSALTVVGIYVVARGFIGPHWSAFAAALAAASPLALANGTVPLSYSLEAAASVWVAALALRLRRRPTLGLAAALGAAIGLAFGLRPSSLIVVGPIGLWAVWGSWRRIGAAVATGSAAVAAWLVPAIVFGGPGLFWFGLRYQSRSYVASWPVWEGGWRVVHVNGAWLASHVEGEALFLCAVALLASVTSLAVVVEGKWREAAGFLAAWSLPGLAFYWFVYAGWPIYPSGYLMGLLPGICVGAALVLRAALRVVSSRDLGAPLRVVATAMVLLVASVPATWVGSWDDALRPVRAAETWESSWDGFKEEFARNDTAIVSASTAAWVQLRHPDYLAWYVQLFIEADGRLAAQVDENQQGGLETGYLALVRDEGPHAPHPIPPWVKRIVFVDGVGDPPVSEVLVPGIQLESVVLPGGHVASVFVPDGLATIEEALAWMQAPPPTPQPPWPLPDA